MVRNVPAKAVQCDEIWSFADAKQKFENHCHALALYFVFYNFCRVHKTLGVTPAMAACLIETPVKLDGIIKMIDEASPARRAVLTRSVAQTFTRKAAKFPHRFMQP